MSVSVSSAKCSYTALVYSRSGTLLGLVTEPSWGSISSLVELMVHSFNYPAH